MNHKVFVAVSTVAGVLMSAAASFALGTRPAAPVPEPATLTLMAIGLGGVAAARKLRNRHKK